MNENIPINTLGEIKLIHLIEEIIIERTGKQLIRDDSLFFHLDKGKDKDVLVLNSDMFNATTDAPKLMNFYQMGRKSVLMNISDLVVKGVKPRGILISLGLPPDLLVSEFKELIRGIIEYTTNWNLNYLGGDLNKSKELIVNPTVFGFKNPEKIIYREGIKEGDILVVNSKFGLTSVGFDILLNRKGGTEEYSKYYRSLMSVLEPKISDVESYLLSDRGLASASIDSSDGLVKSLRDLMLSNKGIGFEIESDEILIDSEAIKYSVEFNIPLKKLIVTGGEEFIHLFTIHPKDYDEAIVLVKSHGGTLIKVGKAISEEKVYLCKEGKREELTSHGYQHFE
jgi:thiamine-monophosphate kinase